MLPERPGPADLVFPEPGLRLVDAEGCGRAERGAEPFGGQILLVEAVAGLVEDPEKRFVEEARVVPGGNPAIAGADAGAERVRRRIQAAGVEVETGGRRGRAGELLLAGDRELAVQKVAVGPL